jgi:hypothetical protein
VAPITRETGTATTGDADSRQFTAHKMSKDGRIGLRHRLNYALWFRADRYLRSFSRTAPRGFPPSAGAVFLLEARHAVGGLMRTRWVYPALVALAAARRLRIGFRWIEPVMLRGRPTIEAPCVTIG